MTDELQEAQRLARAAAEAVLRADEARQTRDDAIVVAVQAGHSTRAIASACGLSGEAVSKIARTRLGSRGRSGRGTSPSPPRRSGPDRPPELF